MWQIIRLFSTSLKCDHWSKTSVFIMLMPLDRKKVQQRYLKGKFSFFLSHYTRRPIVKLGIKDWMYYSVL